MTLSDLHLIWAQRDRRYSFRRYPVALDQVEQVRRWRQAEAEELPLPVRAGAFLEAGRWTPPERIRRIVG